MIISVYQGIQTLHTHIHIYRLLLPICLLLISFICRIINWKIALIRKWHTININFLNDVYNMFFFFFFTIAKLCVHYNIYRCDVWKLLLIDKYIYFVFPAAYRTRRKCKRMRAIVCTQQYSVVPRAWCWSFCKICRLIRGVSTWTSIDRSFTVSFTNNIRKCIFQRFRRVQQLCSNQCQFLVSSLRENFF